MYLYVVRHGDPHYTPVEMLTDDGKKQARALAARFAESGITKIYSSPLRRAIQTAQPTADMLGLPINIESWMSETLAWSRFSIKLPDGRENWIMSHREEADFVRGDAHDALDRWYDIEAMKYVRDAKDGYAALQAESDAFFARHGYVRDGNEYIVTDPPEREERIAVFCHHGFGTTWLSHIFRIPPNIFWAEFDVTHTGVTMFRFRNTESGRTVPKCMTLSDMSHIFADPECDFKYNTSGKNM